MNNWWSEKRCVGQWSTKGQEAFPWLIWFWIGNNSLWAWMVYKANAFSCGVAGGGHWVWTHKLALANWRFLTPSPILRINGLPTVPISGALSRIPSWENNVLVRLNWIQIEYVTEYVTELNMWLMYLNMYLDWICDLTPLRLLINS